MVLTVGFVKARLRATESFQRTVAAIWVWAEKTLAQWAADLVAFPAKELLLKGFLQDLAVKRGSVDARLEHLHNLTVLGLQMARAKYRRNPAILASLKGLDSTDSGRQDIIDDATAWHLAWQRLPEDDQDKVCSVRTRRVRPHRRVCHVAGRRADGVHGVEATGRPRAYGASGAGRYGSQSLAGLRGAVHGGAGDAPRGNAGRAEPARRHPHGNDLCP